MRKPPHGFKQIPDIAFFVDKKGNVVSAGENRRRQIRSSLSKNNGYKIVRLGKKLHYQHRLIALVFIPNPENKEMVAHLDGDKLNNAIDNLQWMSRKEFGHHYKTLGNVQSFRLSGENHPNARLSEGDILEIYDLLLAKIPQKVIATRYEVSINAISDIKLGKRWHHLFHLFNEIS